MDMVEKGLKSLWVAKLDNIETLLCKSLWEKGISAVGASDLTDSSPIDDSVAPPTPAPALSVHWFSSVFHA